MHKFLKPVAVTQRGDVLIVTRHPVVGESPRLRAKFELLVALSTDATNITVTDDQVLTVTLPRGTMALEQMGRIDKDPLRYLLKNMKDVASVRPAIARSRRHAFGVEVGFQHQLDCVPAEFSSALADVYGAAAIVSPEPVYDRHVLEIYIQGLPKYKWGRVSTALRELFNFRS